MMISPAPRRYFRARLVLSRASNFQPPPIRSRKAAQFTLRRNSSSSASSDIARLRGSAERVGGRPALFFLGISRPRGREAGGGQGRSRRSRTPRSRGDPCGPPGASGSGFRFVPGTHAPSLARLRANGCAVRRLGASRVSRSSAGAHGMVRPAPQPAGLPGPRLSAFTSRTAAPARHRHAEAGRDAHDRDVGGGRIGRGRCERCHRRVRRCVRLPIGTGSCERGRRSRRAALIESSASQPIAITQNRK